MQNGSVSVEFSIFGDEFEPTKITEILSLEPTETYKKGLVNIRNRTFKRDECCWSIGTGYVVCNDSSEIINELVLKLKSRKELIKNIIEEYNCYCKLCIVLKVVADNNPGVYLDKSIIQFLNSINAEIDFDIYHW